MIETVVKIKNGALGGKTGTDIRGGTFYSFQGIPYAKPPIGNLRFKAPQPPESWKGIRDATAEGDQCFSMDVFFQNLVGSEDCLHLNVYTPNLYQRNEALKPVMVWFHGGGFTAGSSKSEVYGPEFLVTEDVVLVTLNYRLGVLGFLSLEDPSLDVPGNAGLKDMVMALKWVQQNIRVFGGDPDNVTIFGESAGGASVHYLILSPTAKGLFHKAIIQSGSALNSWARGQKCAKEIAKVLGLEVTSEREILQVLQTIPVKDLYEASAELKDIFVINLMRPHGPVVEKPSKDAFLSKEPLEILKSGNYNHVPIMIGFTSREGLLVETYNVPKPITDFETAIPYFFNLKPGSNISKLVAKKIKNFYYGNEPPSQKNIDKFHLLETDNFFLREIIRSVRYHLATTPAPIYLYRMSIETGLNLFKTVNDMEAPGVAHADDIGYLFKTLLTPEIVAGSVEDIAIRRFTKLWTTFARYGNPNPKERDPLISVEWKPVTKNGLNFLDIGKDLTVGVNPENDRMNFWDEIFKFNVISKL